MVLDGVELRVTDKKNDTANNYSRQLDVSTVTSANSVYKFWCKVENLKVLPGNYDVEVSSKKISHFVNSVLPIQYWIALEPESSYGE